MGRRVSSSGGRRSFGGGFKASSRSSGFRTSRGFRPSTTKHVGGYRYRSRPYRRNYLYHSLSPTGKVLYIIFMIILIFVAIATGY